jgi:exodeoxyribonuclease V alpha subunit
MQAQGVQTIELVGFINTVTFKAADTGYVVLRIADDDFKITTASGVMPDAEKGLRVTLRGNWKTHPRYGEQFNFVSYEIPDPTGDTALVAYISTLKGLGESTARKIVEKFGENTLLVFEEDPDQLLTIRGIGVKNLPGIIKSFNETKGLSRLIGFLHKLGVSASYAPRIYKEYREDSIQRIKADPYILAEEVRGFGFKKADEVALGLEIDPNSSIRIQAAILHVLRGVANMYGHCFLPRPELESMVKELIALPGYQPQTEEVIESITKLKSIKTKFHKRLVEEEEDVYLASYHQAEVELAQKIKQLSGAINAVSIDEWLRQCQDKNGIQLAAGQKNAVVTVESNGLTVITGGAGVGKSTVSKAIAEYWHKLNKRIVAIAPTGKAAQRIREATGLTNASTIHRLLGWTGNGFTHNRDNPVPGDAFLIDESSMVDLLLAYALFEAIPPHASVAIVGDVNQLPSVGAGNVLRDIIASGEIPVARLTEIFRQAATSRIIQASLMINKGEMPVLEQIGRSSGIPTTDALWVNCSQGQIPSAIKWLVSEKLPELGWNKDDIQCLSPMHKGDCGNIELNKLIQEAWNPKAGGKIEQGQFRVGDRVIQCHNNYDKRVFNGDIGKIEKLDIKEKEVQIRFPDLDNPEGRLVKYTFSDLSDLMLAYSISVHKAQGAEFPVVIIPVSMQQYMMLQRNLLYTGVTRAKKLVILVGEEKPLQVAVKTNKIQARNTKLASRLQS